MYDERLRAAIQVLTEEVEAKLREVAETKRTINSLSRKMGEPEPYTDIDDTNKAGSTIRPDQFYGRAFATVAQEFLTIRGRACKPEEVLEGLKAGGYNFKATGWKEGDYFRMVALSLAKNARVFHKLPNGYIGLLDWYPDVTKERTATKGNGSSTEASGESATEEPEEDETTAKAEP